jgi:hypothetical protein
MLSRFGAAAAILLVDLYFLHGTDTGRVRV